MFDVGVTHVDAAEAAWVGRVLGPLLPFLDERQQRLAAGSAAAELGHGGIAAVARELGMSVDRVSDGQWELSGRQGTAPAGRVRRAGGGRKPAEDRDPGLLPELLARVEPTRRGDPMRYLAWTTLSTRVLAQELTEAGHRTSRSTVGKLLRGNGFVLRGNAKVLEGSQHPDRDGQFTHINAVVDGFCDAGDPVVSIDAKKKEMIGDFANPGKTWQHRDEPVKVRDHDFPDRDQRHAIPFGVYDIADNSGWVNVGVDRNTAAFAVASVRRWWDTVGRDRYPDSRRLLITCDAGGANAATSRLFKAELHALALETGLDITVCHFPPGTSKWNKIEHRLFAAITHNWRGRPLTSYEVVLESIAATTTSTGLTVEAVLDAAEYPTGAEVADADYAALPITRDPWHGDWNYTIRSEPAAPHPPPPAVADKHPGWIHADLLGIDPDTFHAMLQGITDDRDTTPIQPRTRPRTRRTTTSGRSKKLTRTDELLATVLRHRYRLRQVDLAALFGMERSQLARIINTTEHLLSRTPHRLPDPADNPPTFTSPHDFTAWADTLTTTS